MTYKVGIIDDDEQIYKLMNELIDGFIFINLALTDINLIVDEIISEKLDAVIIDYSLSDKPGISFTGDDVLSCLHDRCLGFPAVILTGHYIDAEANDESPFIVYDKDKVLNEDYETNEFIRRLNIAIRGYHKKIEEAEEEHQALSLMEDLSTEQEIKLLQLDDFLERVSYGKNTLVKNYKTTDFERKLENLIKSTENLLQQTSQN
jgi:FixJ family two-component response regulator